MSDPAFPISAASSKNSNAAFTNADSTASGKDFLQNVDMSKGGGSFICDDDCALDSRAVLKAFRLIGGISGIHVNELRATIETVQSEHVRKPLLANLDNIFGKYDHDGSGTIDVLEFEKMVKSSSILQAAIYDILATLDDDIGDGRQEDKTFEAELRESVSLALVLLNVLRAAIALDNYPDWEGWHFIELGFVILFSIDIGVRFVKTPSTTSRLTRTQLGPSLLQQTTHCKTVLAKTMLLPGGPNSNPKLKAGSGTSNYTHSSWFVKVWIFFLSPLDVLDFTATLFAWLEMFSHFFDADVLTQQIFNNIQLLRWMRFVRLLRLVRLISYFRDLGSLLMDIVTGSRAVLSGLGAISMIVLIWAIAIRQYLVEHLNDESALRIIFPNVLRTMNLLYRCMVLQSDGACMHTEHGSIVTLLSTHMGASFDVMWLLSELIIIFVLCNIITASFVRLGIENAKILQDIIYQNFWQEDEEKLLSLDKLLRTLIYPGRDKEASNPKDRYAAQVAKMIQTEHPEAAAKIPHLESEVVHFARGISDSKKLLQNAMNRYEAQEVVPCRDLKATPAAQMYMVNGEEVLRVAKDDACVSNSLGIPPAPMSAVEVVLVQKLEKLNDLLNEGKEVQAFVKSKICPQSAWASTEAAGSSGDIRKASSKLCDEAIDPGLKGASRIEQKVNMKYQGRYERNRDYCRIGLVYDNVKHLMDALPRFLNFRLDTEGMEVVSMENRFVHPHPLGWRDITILLRVKVPSSGSRHIMELQLMLRGLMECRGENHRFYEEIRGLLPQDVLMTILDRLVTDTTLDLGITSTEWLQCLHNNEVKKLLDGLGVPAMCRKRLFDLVDLDDSGTVASSELQDMLRLYRSPTQALELAACHMRVREVQRHVQAKLHPQVNKLHKHMINIGSMLETSMSGVAERLSYIAPDHLRVTHRPSNPCSEASTYSNKNRKYSNAKVEL